MFPEIGGKHLYLPDFVRRGQERQHGIVKTASKKFSLFSGQEIFKKHKEFGMTPFNPVEYYPGIVKHHIDPGEFVQGLDKGLYFLVIKNLEFRFPCSGGKMAGSAQYQIQFITHQNTSSILKHIPAAEAVTRDKSPMEIRINGLPRR
jgi:hypothetical protein